MQRLCRKSSGCRPLVRSKGEWSTRFRRSECGLVDETYELAGFVFGGFFIRGEAALGEIVGDGMAVGAANLEGDSELFHDAHEFGFCDGGGQDSEIGEVVGDVWPFHRRGRGGLCGVSRLLSDKRKAKEEGEGSVG